MLDSLSQHIRYALRTLGATPAFTLVVTLSLALGIGANTALFSLVDSLLLRSLPVRDPGRLMRADIAPVIAGGKFKKGVGGFDEQTFAAVAAQTSVVSEVVGFRPLDRPAIAIDGAIEPAREAQLVSFNFFKDLGVAPGLGRGPEATDGPVAVISSRWWRSRFGGSNSVVGKALTVDGQLYTIIGVAPPRFHGFILENSADVWLFSGARPAALTMIVRLQPGVAEAQAKGVLHPILKQSLLEGRPNFPVDMQFETDLAPAGQGISQLREQYRAALTALMVLVTLVLLTTCTNVGNLLMLRSTARRRELTVRAALGAGRSRLVGQYLVESVILAAAGCALGLFLARWGVSLIVSMLPLASVPDSLEFYADLRVVGFAAIVSLAGAFLFGLLPAWRATDVDLAGALRASHGTSATRSARRLGRVLVGSQVALSVLLLVGGGLFVQTMRNLATLDMGFNPKHLLQVSIDTRFAGYGQNQPRGGPSQDHEGEVGTVYRTLRERIAGIPGVVSVTGVRNTLMRRGFSRMHSDLPGLEVPRDDSWSSAEVGPSFFETMGMKPLSGRTFDAADFERRLPIFVVNESFAKRYSPNADLLARVPSIIGIVPDARLFDVRSPIEPTMFEMSRREPDRVNSLQVRVSIDPEAVFEPIRQAVQAVNPRLFIGVTTMHADIEQDLAKERMVAAISAFFSGLGLLIASMGLFGVASYSIARRTKELAIRRALGAGAWTIISESLRETVVVLALGLAVGTAAAIAAVRFIASYMEGLLFGLTATDAANVTLAVVVMVTVALAACTLPAYRATRIDPLTGIRED
ncbi:MAG TPA: ABC transporter permease [Vicinamibacterales bacterium]|nr:ABC transporter permease [Vicinamibacterales bacterium]